MPRFERAALMSVTAFGCIMRERRADQRAPSGIERG
jgi:hypothetical protein